MNNALTQQIEFLNTSFRYHEKRNIVNMIGQEITGSYQICQCSLETFIKHCSKPIETKCALIAITFIGIHAKKHNVQIYDRYLMPRIIDHFEKGDCHPNVMVYRDEDYIDISLLNLMTYLSLECYFKEIEINAELVCQLHNSAQKFTNSRVKLIFLTNINSLCNKFINESLY